MRDIHLLDYWEEDGFEVLEKAIAHQFTFESEESKQPPIIAKQVNSASKETKQPFYLSLWVNTP